MLAIADELRARGHSVVLTANPNLVNWARKSGHEIVPIEYDLDAWFKSEGGQEVLARGDIRTLTDEMNRRERACNRETISACLEACRGADLVASTVITSYRGMAVAEQLGVPHGCLVTFPVHKTRDWAYAFWPSRHLGLGFLNRLTFDLIFQLWWKATSPNVHEMRAELCLPPLSARPPVENLRCALLWSDALVPRPRDWLPHHVMTGYPAPTPDLRARLGEGQLPEALDRWLDAGDPPVFFGFGSMPVRDPRRMLADVTDVTARRGLRALIGAGWTEYPKDGPPPHVFVVPTFDHDRVLPRCTAAVHHGGAGTTGAVLRAGLPALIASVFADQPFWGWRLEKHGVGAHVPFRKLDARAIDRALDRLLDPGVQARAKELGQRLSAEAGAARAAEVVVSWATPAAA